MHDPDLESRARSIAIRLINSRDPKNIETLKKLLFFIRDPRCVRYILTSAILHISATSVETTCWLLQNPEHFQPEVDVVEIITHYLSQTLIGYGLIQDEHYYFNVDGQFAIHSIQQKQLVAANPHPCDQVAFETIHFLIKNKSLKK